MKQESLNPSSCFSLQALKKIMWHGKLLRIGTMSKTLVQEKKKKKVWKSHRHFIPLKLKNTENLLTEKGRENRSLSIKNLENCTALHHSRTTV
jgi:hypothetical protein